MYFSINSKNLKHFSQVVDTLSPLCKSANMNDTIRLANELHHFLDWDQIESEVSWKKGIFQFSWCLILMPSTEWKNIFVVRI